MTTNETMMQNILDDAHLTELMTTLQKELNDFAALMKKTVDPTTWESHADQWAAQHDDEYDYNTHSILNIVKKEELDDKLDDNIGENSFAQQRLRLLENTTPKDKHETIRKSIEIEYITSQLDLFKYDYNRFLTDVTIDEEDLDNKWDRMRETLKCEYREQMRADYADEMVDYGYWTRNRREEFLEDREEIPDEDWVSDYLEDCYL